MTSSFKLILDGSVLGCVSRSRKPVSRIRSARSPTSPSPSSSPLRLLFASFRPLFCQTVRQRLLRSSPVIRFTATSSLRTRPPIFPTLLPQCSPQTHHRIHPSPVYHLPHPSSVVGARQNVHSTEVLSTLPSSSSPPPRLASI